MEINGLKNYYLKDGQVIYNLSAKKYIISLNKNSFPLLIFDTNHYMLKYNFYKNGKFKYKTINLNFKKAYILDKKVVMFGVVGKAKYGKIRAKEAIFYKDKIIFKKCEYNTPKRVYRRKELLLRE